MKILYRLETGRIVGTAVDEYGGPEATVAMPEGFNVEHAHRYLVLAGTLTRVVPAQVPMAKARKALILYGILPSQVDAVIAAIPDDTERALAESDWNYEDAVRRDSPLVASLAPALGLTSAQVDQLFIDADDLVTAA